MFLILYLLPALLWGGPAVGGPPTYAGQISRILDRHCTGCHRPGGVGPFALTSYADARAFATEIRRAVQSRKMPPWSAAPEHGEFQNQRQLTVNEIGMVGAWSDAGAPAGDLARLPPPTQTQSEWPYGPPDLILTPNLPYPVAGTPGEELRCFVIRSGTYHSDTTHATAVRAMDVRPGDAGLVYQVRAFADVTGSARKLNASDSRPGFDCSSGMETVLTRTLLGQWEAGSASASLPSGVGRYLAKGADIILEIRYHRTYRSALDQTKVALYFLRETPPRYIRTQTIANRNLRIAAGGADEHVIAEWVCEQDILAIGVMPHMHRLGTAVKVSAITPVGEVRDLVWVNRYNMYWQTEYLFKKPLVIRKGTIVRVDASYDNSWQNMNLDPGQPLHDARWGMKAEDEMLAVFLEWVDQPAN